MIVLIFYMVTKQRLMDGYFSISIVAHYTQYISTHDNLVATMITKRDRVARAQRAISKFERQTCYCSGLSFD